MIHRFTTTRATFNGQNTSIWEAHVMGVNGFDELLGYGRARS